MAKAHQCIAVTLDRRTLPRVKKRAERMFGPRSVSRYIRHCVDQDLKRGEIR